ncbi:Heat shock 70 kDa protein cognate 4 [Clonorchis sinensis]|uniref:Heat shock 70 kDa protein cognate 4 n=1 Tax=Clonorchis sinensis TaxID=79923 RepID=A0A3R7FA26_CLOSI|nr:Heat shock 70 kDa protein cognate 4 [Clonorchis sinensis]
MVLHRGYITSEGWWIAQDIYTMTIIGIDLGTSNTCAAFYRDGKPELVFDISCGVRIIPSYVAYDGNEWMVGPTAKHNSLENLKNTVFEAKRLIGRLYADPDVTNRMWLWPFEIVNSDSVPQIRLEKKVFSVEFIQSKLLEYVKCCAESQLKESVKEAVISVPAYFSSDQRDATKRAAEMAGLVVRQLIHEPTAAAIAYGWKCQSKSDRTVLIYDLGGGTFDVSVLKITGRSYSVLAINGDISLGGRDIDENMVKKFVEEVKPRRDITKDSKAIFELREKCELAKRTLTCNVKTKLFVADLGGKIDFRRDLSRAEFEQLNQEIFNRTLDIVKQALSDANLAKDQVDEVLMVGGSSRIPKIEQMLIEFFGRDCLNRSLNPDEVVGQGAAILAASLENEPPEETKGFELFEVTPRSLGIKTLGGISSCVVKRNTRLPCSNQERYSTAYDNQTAIQIDIYEGERVLQKHNNLLGTFTLTGIRAAKEGEVKILVNFELDESGCLTVSAEEREDNMRNQIVIQRAQRQSGERVVERSIYGAEGHEEEDKKYLECHKRWKIAYHSIFQMKRNIEATIPEPRKSELLEKCDETSQWFRTNELVDDDVWKPKLDDLHSFCGI